MDEDEELLREMLRESEAVLAHQLHVADESDDKTEQLLTLAVATFGGALAFLAFVAGRGALPAWFTFVWIAGVALDIAAATGLVATYVGFFARGSRRVGPSPGWLAARANDPDWSVGRHLATVIANNADFFDANERQHAIDSRARRASLVLICGAVLMELIAGIFVLIGGI